MPDCDIALIPWATRTCGSSFLPYTSAPVRLARTPASSNQLTLVKDNAAMIANVGISRLKRGRVDDLDVMQQAKWSIDQCEADFEPASPPSV